MRRLGCTAVWAVLFLFAGLIPLADLRASERDCAQLLAGDRSDLKVLKYYRAVAQDYAHRRAARSQILLINHIDEGLVILQRLGADWRTKAAWCIHPLVQGDADLARNFELIHKMDPQVVALALEYRNIANATLSHRTITGPSDIGLSPLSAVNQMLVADKVQNRKDFELAHAQTHPRAAVLDRYFKGWLMALGVSEQDYRAHVAALSAHPEDYIATGAAPVLTAKVGPHAVGHATLLFSRKAEEGGDLLAEAFFPETPRGRYPVIVFAHGGGLNGQSHAFLGRFWASHGYVAVHPTLPGADSQILANSDRATMTAADREANRQALINLGATAAPIERSIHDLNHILAELPGAMRAIPGWRSQADLSRLGLAGYSFGAQTVLAGVRGRHPELAGVQAVFAISPPGRAFAAFGPETWQGLDLPMMLVSGTADLGLNGEPAELRAEPFWQSPQGNKSHALLTGVNHFSFVYTRPGKEAFDQQVHEQLKLLSLLYWDRWLMGLPGRQALFESLELKEALQGRAELFSR